MSEILFKNANLVLPDFTKLQPGCDVLVKGNHIATVSSAAPIHSPGAMVIDVAGKTLMPGLIDAHAHITGLNLSPRNISYPIPEITLACATYLKSSLFDGFTSIREAG